MSTNTYVALATQTLGSAVSSVTFSSIPQGYTDLVVVQSGTTTSLEDITVQFNNVTTGGLYSYTALVGNGSTASSNRQSNMNNILLGGLGTVEGNNIFHFMNYSNSTTFKTALSRNNIANWTVSTKAGLWRSTAAITEINFSHPNTFLAGSTFNLYGIAATSVGAKATGGDIYADASYFYHVFDVNGTFTPTQAISADILVVAGGGGGGANMAGGGGAGGVLGFSSQSLTTTNYTCTVGAGGAGNTTNAAPGATGSNSQFAALTLVQGGGGGGTLFSKNGLGGGSGGGGAGGYDGGTGGSAGAGTSGQGFAGGTGATGANNALLAGAGGGGAGSIGANGSGSAGSSIGGNGGSGVSSVASYGSLANTLLATGLGVNGLIAGGGGGGVRADSGAVSGSATGGGGAGSGLTRGSRGTPNTGGGGGGGGNSTPTDDIIGYNGGSGVVIIRYAR